MSKKIYIHTFGCKVNQYDSQVLRERSGYAGYEPVKTPAEADLIVINSCTVTAEADRQCRQLARQLAQRNPSAKIVVTGCYAVRAGGAIAELPESAEVVADRTTLFSAASAAPRTITAFDGHSRAFVKVQDGCDAFCSYCIVPTVRPTLWSKPAEEAVEEVRRLVAAGYPEIVLTGVHIGKYEGGLETLLRRLVAMDGEFRIRLSSIEVREVTDEMISLMAANSGRICAHLHLPLQSGSDNVLKRMRRPYTAAEFAKTMEKLHRAVPGIGISTDVIVGFPGETDQEFADTRDFLADRGFARLHVFRYSPREGTDAAAFKDQVSAAQAKQRAGILADLDRALQDRFWKQYIGTARPAVREGAKGTYLTDNYIRLTVDPSVGTPEGAKIVSLRILDRGHSAFGVVS